MDVAETQHGDSLDATRPVAACQQNGAGTAANEPDLCEDHSRLATLIDMIAEMDGNSPALAGADGDDDKPRGNETRTVEYDFGSDSEAEAENGGGFDDGTPQHNTASLFSLGIAAAFCAILWLAVAHGSSSLAILANNVVPFRAPFSSLSGLWSGKYNVHEASTVVVVCAASIAVAVAALQRRRRQITDALAGALFGRHRRGLKAHLVRIFVISAKQDKLLLHIGGWLLVKVFEAVFTSAASRGIVWTLLDLMFYLMATLQFVRIGSGCAETSQGAVARHMFYWFASGATRLHTSFMRRDCNGSGCPEGFVAALAVMLLHAVPTIALGMASALSTSRIQVAIDSAVLRRVSRLLDSKTGGHRESPTEPKSKSLVLLLCRVFSSAAAAMLVVALSVVFSDGIADEMAANFPEYSVSWSTEVSVVLLVLLGSGWMQLIALDRVIGILQLLRLVRLEVHGVNDVQVRRVGGDEDAAAEVRRLMDSLHRFFDGLVEVDVCADSGNSAAEERRASSPKTFSLTSACMQLYRSLRTKRVGNLAGDLLHIGSTVQQLSSGARLAAAHDKWLGFAMGAHLKGEADAAVTLPQVTVELQEVTQGVGFFRSAASSSVLASLVTAPGSTAEPSIPVNSWQRGARDVFLAFRGTIFRSSMSSARRCASEIFEPLEQALRAVGGAAPADERRGITSLRCVAQVSRSRAGVVCPPAWANSGRGVFGWARYAAYMTERLLHRVRPLLPNVEVILCDFGEDAPLSNLVAGDAHTGAMTGSQRQDKVVETLAHIDVVAESYMSDATRRALAEVSQGGKLARERLTHVRAPLAQLRRQLELLTHHHGKVARILPGAHWREVVRVVWPAVATINRLVKLLRTIREREAESEQSRQQCLRMCRLTEDCLTAFYRQLLSAAANVAVGGDRAFAGAAAVVLLMVQQWQTAEVQSLVSAARKRLSS